MTWWRGFDRVDWEDLKRGANSAANAANVRAPDDVVEFAINTLAGSQIREVRRPEALLFNDIAFVRTSDDRELVVRIRKGSPRHFDGERWAMDAARLADVPVPEVLGTFDLDEWSICVQTRMPGVSLEAVLLESSSDDVLADLGRVLRLLHNIAPAGPVEVAPSFFIDLPSDIAQRCERSGVPFEAVDHAAKILAGASDDAKTVCLLHGDFVSDQVLVESDRVSAILDLEHAKRGDPAWDFAYWTYNNRHPSSLDAMFAGYGPVHEGFRERILLHRLRLSIDWLVRQPVLEGVFGAFVLQRFEEDLGLTDEGWSFG